MAELETQLTLTQVARRYGVAPDALTQMMQDGIIKATKESKETPAVIVSDIVAAVNTIREEIKPEHYAHLRGQRIRLMEASRIFCVSEQNLYHWSEREYIQVINRDFQRMELDKSDVAYIVDVFKRAVSLTGSPVRAGWVLKRIFA